MLRNIDFNDASVFDTIPNVPVLDEHELTGEDGQGQGYVDRAVLEQIAANNNRRVRETGDPAPLIIGHTSDDPKAPEKPVIGYAVNYRVKPFKRNPDGSVKYAIYSDFKVYHKHAEEAKRYYPRRSVELWVHRKELDPIALLGGTTPERDLGVIIRRARVKAVAILGGSTPERDLGVSLHYSRAAGSVLRYGMADLASVAKVMGNVGTGIASGETGQAAARLPGGLAGAVKSGLTGAGSRHLAPSWFGPEEDEESDMPRPMQYSSTDMNGDGPCQYGAGDDDPEGELPDDGAEGGVGGEEADDPVVDKILSSKKFLSAIQAAVTQAIDSAIGGGEDPGGEPGMDDGMGGPGMGAPPAGGMGAPPPGAGGPPGAGAPEEDAAMFHGDRPVKFNSGTGMPGPGSVYAPGTGETGKRYARQPAPVPQRSRPMTRPPESDEVVRLRRKSESQDKLIRDLVVRNARADARETVNQLKAEGVVFGQTPEEAARGEAADIEFLAQLDTKTRQDYVNNTIRAKYARRPHDPGNPAAPGLARFAAPGVVGDPDADLDSVLQSNQDAVAYADAVANGNKPADVLKMMRQRRAVRRA